MDNMTSTVESFFELPRKVATQGHLVDVKQFPVYRKKLHSTIFFPGYCYSRNGAGFHSVVHEAEYKEACKAACIKATRAINEGVPAVEVVSLAISTLEDSPCTNAGIGSNLSRTGSIECDASIIDGESSGFGAVGALKGIRNPIQVACKLLQEELKGPSASGLVPPIFLAGEGAFQWAREHGFPEYPDKEMMTDRSIQTWKKCKLQQQHTSIPKESGSNKRFKIEDLCNVANENAEVMDTVGAVCMDSRGNLSAGVSSGGVVYKTPGRIGQAAVYGSGCWATGGENCVAVACSTSGCGEQLIKTMLAKECANLALSRDAVSAVQEGLTQTFLGSRSLSSVDQKLGGVLLLRLEGDEGNSHSNGEVIQDGEYANTAIAGGGCSAQNTSSSKREYMIEETIL